MKKINENYDDFNQKRLSTKVNLKPVSNLFTHKLDELLTKALPFLNKIKKNITDNVIHYIFQLKDKTINFLISTIKTEDNKLKTAIIWVDEFIQNHRKDLNLSLMDIVVYLKNFRDELKTQPYQISYN